MDLVIAHELQILGSHGMAAHDYPRLLALVGSGRFPLARLVGRTLPLEAGPRALADVATATAAGACAARHGARHGLSPSSRAICRAQLRRWAVVGRRAAGPIVVHRRQEVSTETAQRAAPPTARTSQRSVLRSSVFGGLAAAWWIAAAFDALELPNSAVVLVIGLVASALAGARPPVPTEASPSVPGTPSSPCWSWPPSSRSRSAWTCCSGGYRSSRSRAPDDARRGLRGAPRFAETREFRDVAVLGHRGDRR